MCLLGGWGVSAIGGSGALVYVMVSGFSEATLCEHMAGASHCLGEAVVWLW